MNNDLISGSALLEELNDTKYAWQDYDAVEAALRNIPAVDAVEVVRCENCTHQQKVWHDDKRMKEGGFFYLQLRAERRPICDPCGRRQPGRVLLLGETEG